MKTMILLPGQEGRTSPGCAERRQTSGGEINERSSLTSTVTSLIRGVNCAVSPHKGRTCAGCIIGLNGPERNPHQTNALSLFLA